MTSSNETEGSDNESQALWGSDSDSEPLFPRAKRGQKKSVGLLKLGGGDPASLASSPDNEDATPTSPSENQSFKNASIPPIECLEIEKGLKVSW